MRIAAAGIAATFLVAALGRAIDYELATAAPPRVTADLGDGTLIDAINRQRAKTWRCQIQLGRQRSHVSYAAERSRSLAFRRWTHRLWHKRAAFNCHLARQLSDPVRAIYAVFGAYGAQAVRVASCETGGTFDIYARNGQYLGLFQVSAHWRRTVPGFAYTAYAQARHAYRVFRLTGSNWSHWTCRP